MKSLALLAGSCVCLAVAPLVAAGPNEAAQPPKPTPPATPANPAPSTPASGTPAAPSAPGPAANDREAMLLKIAGAYSEYHLGSPWPLWALARCRAFTSPQEITGVPSRSDDERTHGTKLYKLWVSDYDSYMRLAGVEPTHTMFPPTTKAEKPLTEAPVGQTLVKETFAAVKVPRAEEPKPNPYREGLIVDGDQAYRQGAPGELFIMTKLDPKTPDTDLGWVYAVVSADHKTVLRSGRLNDCMRCHEGTTRDRLYGPESTWPKDPAGKPTPPVVKRDATHKPQTTRPASKALDRSKSDH